MTKKKKSAPWFKYWAVQMSRNIKGLRPIEIGILHIILIEMWECPTRWRLTWSTGESVKMNELHSRLELEKEVLNKALYEILRKSHVLELSETGELTSPYLKEQANSWKKHGRGDK